MDPRSLSLYEVNALRVRENNRPRLTKFVDFIGLIGETVFVNKNDTASGNCDELLVTGLSLRTSAIVAR